MIIACPKCGKSLNVPEGMGGKQAQCPTCQCVFVISTPAPAPAVPVAPPQPQIYTPPPAYGAPQAAMPKAPCKCGATPWRILGIAGAALCVVAFFVPWWGMSLDFKTPDRDRDRASLDGQIPQDLMRTAMFPGAGRDGFTPGRDRDDTPANPQEEAGEILDKNEKWYDSVFSPEAQRDFQKQLVKTQQASIWAWGWDTTTGLLGFIFGLISLPLLIVPMFVGALKKWSWTMVLPGAAFGLVVLIMALVFWLSCPGKDVSPVLSQGAIVGPYVALGGGLLLAAGAGLDGTCGLMKFLKKA